MPSYTIKIISFFIFKYFFLEKDVNSIKKRNMMLNREKPKTLQPTIGSV
jgi:hypothetical protein